MEVQVRLVRQERVVQMEVQVHLVRQDTEEIRVQIV